MSETIKPKIIFQGDEDINAKTYFDSPKKRIFDQEDSDRFILEGDEAENEDSDGRTEGIISNALKPKRSLWKNMVLAGIGLFAISTVAQGIQWINLAWQQQNWIGLGASCAGAMMIIAGIGAVISEWRHLYRLRERAEERDEAKVLLSSHGLNQGRAFCEKIAAQAGIDKSHPALMKWQSSLHETHSDREIVELYASLVQPVLDKQANAAISRYAAEAALMIAVSPLALVDMAFIAWRNIKLINQIAQIYGIKLGYFSRMRLFRLVLLNIAFAGASELIREVGMDWLSQDIAARLSARVAQGIGAGLLTARLGIKAMELCRSLPWLQHDRPKLSDFRRQLMIQLKRTLPGKMG